MNSPLPIFLTLILTLASIGDIQAQAASPVAQKIAAWLTPEKCASHQPEALYEDFLRSGDDSPHFEQAQDRFHEIYARLLMAHTDQRFPEAAKIREPLWKAYSGTFEFIRTANGMSGTAHGITRLAAKMEWDIWQGYHGGFDLHFSGEHTLEDIRSLAAIYRISQGRMVIGQVLPDIQKTLLEPAIGQLEEAEQSMKKEAVLYFRARIVSVIASYLAR